MYCIIEETVMRSGRQISNVFSNKFIDEENEENVKCRSVSVNSECQPSSDKV